MIALIIVLLTLITSYFAGNLIKDEVELRLEDTLRNTSKLIESDQMSIQDQLSFVSELHEMKVLEGTMHSDDVDSILTTLLEHNTDLLEVVFIALDDGKIQYSSDPDTYLDVDISDREYYKQSMTNQVTWSDVLTSKVTGNQVQVISLPIKDQQGNAIGILAAAIKFSHFVELFNGIRIGEQGYAYVVNREGVLISHPKPDYINKKLEEFNIPALTQAIPDIISGGSSLIEYSHMGVDKINMYAPLGMWSMSMNAGKDDVYAGLSKLPAT